MLCALCAAHELLSVFWRALCRQIQQCLDALGWVLTAACGRKLIDRKLSALVVVEVDLKVPFEYKSSVRRSLRNAAARPLLRFTGVLLERWRGQRPAAARPYNVLIQLALTVRVA